MKTTILLCFLVALGAAKQHDKHDGAWQQQTEYRYKVHTHNLAAIPNLKNQWVGSYTKADLILHPKSKDVLIGKLQNEQHSEWHDALPEGPAKYLPDSELSYQPTESKSKPFEIRMNEGAIHSIAVDEDMTNVELNQLKSILSQFQVDIKARNLMKSPRNHLPQNNDNDDNDSQALYKVMEPTVTGKCESFYDISRVPMYMAQAYPEYNSKVQLKQGEHFYEVYKTKNYTNCEQRMGYHFGIHGMNDWQPNTNLMGSLTKSAVSRIIISGSFDKFTIRSSVTTNRVVKANPEKDTQHDSMVVSQVNVTLVSMEETQSQPQIQSERLVDVGNLVYSYDLPSDSKNSLRTKKDSSEMDENNYDDDNEAMDQDIENMYNGLRKESNNNNNNNNNNNQEYKLRAPRSIDSRRNTNTNYAGVRGGSRGMNNKEYYQPKPSMKYAPENPLLNYFVGNKGQSIQNAPEFDAPTEVQKLADEIARDLDGDVAEVPVKQTLRKFNILAKIIRTMHAEQIEQTTRNFEQKDQKSTAQKVYRDALLSAGTGPAINELMGWIEEGKLKGEEAAEVTASFPKTIREPTEEMQQRFFDFVKNDGIKKQSNVNTTAGIAFTRFMFRAQVNNKGSSKYYPVDTYGHLAGRNNEFVSQQVIPYFAHLLQTYARQQDGPNTLYAIRALGNMGHPQTAKVFEKYLNGEERVSDFQRLAMVLALDKYAINHKKEAQVILYQLYQNKGETNEIRSAAIFQMMRTHNPVPAALQRWAEETNTEESPYVRAAIRSALESASRLTNPENVELARNAKAALNLLKPEEQAVQYSRTSLRDYTVKQIEATYEQQSSYIVNGDSFIPSGVFVNTVGKLGGFTRRAEYQAIVNSVEELMNAISDNVKAKKSWNNKNQNNQNENQNANDNDYDNEDATQQQTTWSAEKIIKLLNVKPNKAKQQQLEGQILLDIIGSERLLTFDKQSIEQAPHQLKKLANKLRNGVDVKYIKLYNQDDVTISFPLETGIPFTFTSRTPTMIQVNGQIRARSTPEVADNAENEIRIPESVNVTGEIDAVYSVQHEVIVSFINPSTSKRYTAGYDKKVQLNVPVRISSDIDIRNREIKTEIKPMNTEKSTKFLQMGSWPFTTRDNIFKFRPMPQSEHTKEIRARPTRDTEIVFGEKQTGYAFVVKGTQEKDSNQISNIYNQLRKHDLTSFLLFGQQDTSPEHYSLTVELDAKRSTTKATKFIIKYDQETVNGQNQNTNKHAKHPRARGQSADESTNMAIPQSDEANSQPRREQFQRNAAEGMTSADANVVDVSVQFVGGQKKHEYVATVSRASSKTEGKSRILFFAQKSTSESQNKAVYLQVDAKYQTANELRQQQNQQNKPFADVKFRLSYSLVNVLDLATIKGKMNMKQTAKVQQYMQNLYKWTSSVEKPTVYPNTVDQIDVEIDYENASVEDLEKKLGVKVSNIYNYVRYATQMDSNENREHQGQHKKIEFEIRFTPDMQSANVTMRAPALKTEWTGIRVPSMTKNVVVVPTNWNLLEEVKREIIQDRDSCLVSGQETNTFENRTVKHGALGRTWHLAVHKMREEANWQNQNENNKRVHYVSALVRDAQQSNQESQQQTYEFIDNESQSNRDAKMNKEVLIVLHQQKQNDITVQLSPSNEHKNTPRVLVNGKEQDLSQSSSKVIRSSENPKDILARVYAIEEQRGEQQQSTRSVRVETTQGNLEVTYNGKNVQFRSNGFNRNNRGICGSFTGQKATELKSPENKIINNDKEFAASWAVVDDNSNADYTVKELKQRVQQKHYPTEEMLYSNPVSNLKKSEKPTNDDENQEGQESPRAQNWEERKHTSNSNKPVRSATKHQTQFVEDDDQQRICFTKLRLPTCTPGHRANGVVKKTVEVFCLNSNNSAAQQYKSQIKSGRDADMSSYETTKKMTFAVPKRCEQQI